MLCCLRPACQAIQAWQGVGNLQLDETRHHVTLLGSCMGAVSYSPSIVTMAVSLTVYEIFRVKE